MKTRLKPKEQLFCRLIADGYSPEDAAFRAGYRTGTKRIADRLMQRIDIRKSTASLASERQPTAPEAGYRRLAFGGIADAVRLCCGELPDDIGALDLFCVQEIKRTDKGVEIKFFDRIKALDRLAELSVGESDSAAPFYRALEQSALRLNGDEQNGV